MDVAGVVGLRVIAGGAACIHDALDEAGVGVCGVGARATVGAGVAESVLREVEVAPGMAGSPTAQSHAGGVAAQGTNRAGLVVFPLDRGLKVRGGYAATVLECEQ